MFRRRRSEPAPAPTTRDDPVADARETAAILRDELGWPPAWALEQDGRYVAAVQGLRDAHPPTEALLDLLRGDHIAASMALDVLRDRDDLPGDWRERLLERLPRTTVTDEHYTLKALAVLPGRLIGAVLAVREGVTDDGLVAFVDERIGFGEPVDAETFEGHVAPLAGEQIAELLGRDARFPEALRAAFAAWWRPLAAQAFVRAFARVWAAPYDEPPASLAGSRGEVLDRLVDALAGAPRRSIALIGEHGAGKTTLLRAALDRAPGSPLVFEASAADVNAGAVYVGELEGRVQAMLDRLRDVDAVWVLPALEQALWSGQHARSPSGLLDAVLPHVASGALTVAALVSPSGWELLVKERPQVAAAFLAVRVPALDEADALAVAEHALEHDGLDVRASDAVLREANELALQFVPGSASPGGLIRLVTAAAKAAAEQGRAEMTTNDLLRVVAATSGLPLAILDPDAAFDSEEVRAFFTSRVLGQPEAVQTLVERIAMIKAGLTDPSRPLGVFLFVGPTGTGKTEIAKALAEFLFGSASRMVRLDMTEFQTPDSLERLLADASVEPRAAPLLAAVRKEPFAVVLLDEFEKAAAPIWDVFLQLFDDGRLTDVRGRTADFRRCVVILTSNVGGAISAGGLGFERRGDAFSPRSVERALARSFRPEFLNRIDRVVVFRPFERGHMRALLDKELKAVVERRGLRSRPWAIEYDESALTFLIDRGFSPQHGARPLKRAVERYLLAPLARAIVERRVPSGEQFLFVTARGDGLQVRWVDPDAEEPDRVPVAAPSAGLDVRRIALSPSGGAETRAYLRDELERLGAAIRGPAVQDRKAAALAQLGRPGFWDDPGRFSVLAEAHYLDRLEEAHRTAERLGGRLERVGERNGGGAQLAGLLALRLHVLACAVEGLESDAADELFLRIRPVPADGELATRCADRIADMYLAWAERRGMHAEPLMATADGVHLLHVGGLGAGVLLERERGLHVFEADDDTPRVTIAVDLAARPPETATARDLTAVAEELLGAAGIGERVVRRYRERDAPLVRDAARGYRTGRLDRVLAGDFDLF